jgi:iron only hydrogenase large subunit-like protein
MHLLGHSGCITSAETVLVQLQSSVQFKAELAKLGTPLAITSLPSLSPSSLPIAASSSSSSSSTSVETLALPSVASSTGSSNLSSSSSSPPVSVSLSSSSSLSSPPQPYIMIVSISPQSRAAIAQQFGLSLLQV